MLFVHSVKHVWFFPFALPSPPPYLNIEWTDAVTDTNEMGLF